MVNFQPDGYGTANIGITVDGAADAIEFYKTIFGATERMRFEEPDGKIGHAELQIGDSVVMLNDPYPDMDVHAPSDANPGAVSINLFVPDADATVAAAVEAGAKLVRPVEDQFYGDRSGQILCPWGHRWGIATHIEDVSMEDMQSRAADLG